MIVGLFADQLLPGGIQRSGRHIAAVIFSFAQSHDQSCRLLSLNDPLGVHEQQIGGIRFEIEGFGGHKTQFVLTVLRLAPITRLMIIAHPHFAPIGLLTKVLHPSVRYLVAAHGDEVWEPLTLTRRFGLRLANAVMSPSRYTAEKVARIQGVDIEKVSILPWALDPTFLEQKNHRASDYAGFHPGFKLLTVARLAKSSREKGVDTVINALPLIHKTFPQTHYVIVGDGDDRLRLESLAEGIGLAGHVVFAGETTEEELAAYYSACDVFVMPSRVEGFGLVFLEAMAHGKPVVAGDHGGTPDVVIDGITGYLVKYGDKVHLADRITRLLSDHRLGDQMGEAGRRRVEENFAFDLFHKRLARLLTMVNAG